jgi:CobQ-like glutamine amidotransferase family enzyme
VTGDAQSEHLSPGPARVLRLCALYPDLMNIYADRGNLLVLKRRCVWRGIGFELTPCGLGEQLHEQAHDIFYLGGGQDRDQRLCAEDLIATKRAALHAAAARGAVVLGVCGGYQLLGRSYELGPGEELPGVGLLDVRTVREDGPRLIGNVAIEVALGGDGSGSGDGSSDDGGGDDGGSRVLAGFENHGGRTYLGSAQPALGLVVSGYGNDGRSRFEGARSGNVIGTYLHGPLLPKNIWFADWLIATALGIDIKELAPLDDTLEEQAHHGARSAAGGTHSGRGRRFRARATSRLQAITRLQATAKRA